VVEIPLQVVSQMVARSGTDKTPVELGFRWPAEWETQKQAFLGFPSRGDWFRQNAGTAMTHIIGHHMLSDSMASLRHSPFLVQAPCSSRSWAWPRPWQSSSQSLSAPTQTRCACCSLAGAVHLSHSDPE
jgi:hypothetical protein